MHGKKGYQLKEDSVADARTTPPTIGTREPTTHAVGFCQKTNHSKRQEPIHNLPYISE